MRHLSNRRVASPALLALALGTTAASCNLVLGLDAFIDCPEDPKCPALTNTGSGGATSTTTTPSNTGGSIPSPTCDDTVKNGGETDIDCGGPCTNKCADDKGCATGGDCLSKVCSPGGTCVAASCTDTVSNGDETDDDCGGMCPPCAFNKVCAVDGDCEGGLCVGMKCAATCTDKLTNGAESDEDCGGPTCPKCVIDKQCAMGPDCETGVCQATKCQSNCVWAKGFGEAQEQVGAVVTANALGQSFVFSKVTGSVDFGNGVMTAATNGSLAGAKFDSAGNVLWSKIFNAHTSSLFGNGTSAAATDPYGDVAFTGTVDGAADFGGGLPGGTWGAGNLFIAKLDPAGGHMWTKEFAAAAGAGIGFHVTDHMVVAGTLASTSTNFGCGALPTSGANGGDIFAVSFNYTGGCVWSKRFGNNQFDTIASMATDGAGNVLLTGLVNGTLTLGGGTVTGPVGDPAIFVSKLSSGGVVLWSRAFGPPGMQGSFNQPTSIAATSLGDFYVAGRFRDTIDFGDGPHTSTTTQDLFLVKIDGAGSTLWSKTFAGGSLDFARQVAIDGFGNVILVGSFTQSIDLGGGAVPCAPGLSCAFVAKLDGQGNHLWSRSFGSVANAAALSVAAVGVSNAMVTGYFQGLIDFGAGTITTKGNADVFLADLLLP